MTNDMFTKMYWSQYLLYEKEFLSSADYVMIDKLNYPVFSNQYVKLLLGICSEIDSITSAMCDEIGDDEQGRRYVNIIQKMSALKKNIPSLLNTRVKTIYPYSVINIVPFASFSENGASKWWQDYNALKHSRASEKENGRFNYQSANLDNVLTSLSALYILNCSLSTTIQSDMEISRESKIFEIV